MDLKALREQAINEANDTFSKEKINDFKRTIKNIISKISSNNSDIELLQENNKRLKKQLNDYELKEFKRVTL